MWLSFFDASLGRGCMSKCHGCDNYWLRMLLAVKLCGQLHRIVQHSNCIAPSCTTVFGMWMGLPVSGLSGIIRWLTQVCHTVWSSGGAVTTCNEVAVTARSLWPVSSRYISWCQMTLSVVQCQHNQSSLIDFNPMESMQTSVQTYNLIVVA